MKKLFIFVLIFSSVPFFLQSSFQGKAVYVSKTTVDLDAWGRGNMTPQQKKQMMARMKNFLEKSFTLNFDQTASTFKENAKLDAPGTRGSRWGGNANGSIYKNLKDKKMIEDKEFFGKRFLIIENMEQPVWELSGESKKIGNYICYKATYTKVNNNFDWSVFRRRRGARKDSIKTKNDKPEERKLAITAWYTPQIPVSAGPAGYWGLPGLILELNAGRTTMLCSELVINPTEKIAIKIPIKGEEISRKEYNAIVKQKMTEMRERFRSKRGGRRRF